MWPLKKKGVTWTSLYHSEHQVSFERQWSYLLRDGILWIYKMPSVQMIQSHLFFISFSLYTSQTQVFRGKGHQG